MSAMNPQELPNQDRQAYVVITDYGSICFYFDREAALDHVTRKDKLYHVRLTDWDEITAR